MMSFQATPTPKFAPHYLAWGPESEAVPPTLAAAQAYCKEFATSHYENFSVVSWLLPQHLRQHFYNVYAFCRWSDDLGDELEVHKDSMHPLSWWRNQLIEILNHTPTHPVLLALRETILSFEIPLQPFLNLVSAFEQDQQQKSYSSFTELLQYCDHSANPVGKIILYLARCPTSENLAYSDSICTGLQLANFWQDVRRDHELGRIYLPQDDLLKFNVNLQELTQKIHTLEFAQLMQFEVNRARTYLQRGTPLFTRVPKWLNYDLKLFQRGGLTILSKIEQHHFRVFESRPKLSKLDFLKISLYSLLY